MTDAALSGILWICGAVVAAGGAANVIIRLTGPYRKLKARVDAHDTLLDSDNRRLKAVEDMSRQICLSVVTLLDHAATGNSMDKCKARRDELMKYLAAK